MKRLLYFLALIPYFALPHLAHAQTAFQTCAFSDPTHCYGIGPGNAGQAYMSNGASAYPSFSSSLPGVTSIGGVIIPATASEFVTGATTTTAGQCLLSTTTAGLGAWATCPGGGGGTPGGSNFELQYNNSGAFGGIALGTLGQPLLSDGSSGAPVFGTLDLSFTTGTLACAELPAFTGDVTNTNCAMVVGQINGSVVPTSASVLGSNASRQLVAATTTGSGTTVVLATSPALTTPNIGAATGTSLSLSGQLTSTVTTGTAPLVVASTTQVANLNAASVGGFTLPCTVPTLVNGDFLTNNGTTCSWAAASAVTLQTNGTNNTSQTTLNLQNGQGVVITNPSGGNATIATTVPQRTVTTSPTIASTDMGGAIFMNVTGGGTLTVPAISSTVLASGMSVGIVNYSASTAAVSTTPTINSGGGCVTATGIPSGDTWQLISNGTTLDCIQTVSAATRTIASGTATLGTSAVSSGACATVVTVSAPGVATTDVVKAGFNGDPTAVTGYGVSATGAVLTIYPYPTAGNVSFKVCNSSSASITPGAMTLNWSVTR